MKLSASKIFCGFQDSHSSFENHTWVDDRQAMARLKNAVVHKLGNILGFEMEELKMGIFIFIDGKKKKTCRPTRHQRAAYSGYIKGHGINFQGGMLPNGINIAFLPMETARCSDPRLYRLTSTEERFQNISRRIGSPFIGYADKLYPYKERLVRTPKGVLEGGQKALRSAFSAVRQAVEWGFGVDSNNHTGNDYFRKLKLLQSSAGVGALTWVCVFISNCNTCMRGSNQVSSYFGIDPPTLAEFTTIPPRVILEQEE